MHNHLKDLQRIRAKFLRDTGDPKPHPGEANPGLNQPEVKQRLLPPMISKPQLRLLMRMVSPIPKAPALEPQMEHSLAYVDFYGLAPKLILVIT